jgi:hypothetical protein
MLNPLVWGCRVCLIHKKRDVYRILSLSMDIYIYIYIYSYMYIYIYIYIYSYIYTHTYTHTCILRTMCGAIYADAASMYAHTHVHVYERDIVLCKPRIYLGFMCICIWACIFIHTNITHTCVYVYECMYSHNTTRICTYTHEHTIQACGRIHRFPLSLTHAHAHTRKRSHILSLSLSLSLSSLHLRYVRDTYTTCTCTCTHKSQPRTCSQHVLYTHLLCRIMNSR